ncbi:MAG TPA: VOC family protein [Candidatus Binatia bacterium]|nr:VOC family protein [Candidatus Binatia bacterium]
MRFNRSVPPCAVIPVLTYPDPTAAAEWLSEAFGFTVRLRIANHRIQMKAGEGCFTIREGNVTPNHSQSVQVRIEDAKGHCERSRQNGAIILSEPTEHPYGERQYNAQDFHGHRWDFTETVADVAPEEWSDGEFHLE